MQLQNFDVNIWKGYTLCHDIDEDFPWLHKSSQLSEFIQKQNDSISDYIIVQITAL